jgi:hypothetical protein
MRLSVQEHGKLLGERVELGLLSYKFDKTQRWRILDDPIVEGKLSAVGWTTFSPSGEHSILYLLHQRRYDHEQMGSTSMHPKSP